MVWINGLKMVLFRVFGGYTWMMSFVEEKANPMNQPSTGFKIVSLLCLGRIPKETTITYCGMENAQKSDGSLFLCQERFALGIDEIVLTRKGKTTHWQK